MGARRFGDWGKLALWLVLAGLGVWLATGGMQAELESGLVGFLWVLAGVAGALLLLCGAGAAGWLRPLLEPVPRPEPLPAIGPVWLRLVIDGARAVVVVALLAAGRPALAIGLGVCLIGYRLFRPWARKWRFRDRGGATTA